MRANTDWFKDAKWGVFIHYLAETFESATQKKTTVDDWDRIKITVDDWNRMVDSFDVKGLAGQLELLGAKYIFITLGQNSGYYCAPNETYDRIVGINPSKCSRRDLVGDLADEIIARGIRLLVYLPGGAPSKDPPAIKELEYKRNGGRLAEFQIKWETVIREWSLRWGKKISGWWVDGCYYADDMYRHAAPPNFKSFASAMKSGNPDSIVAFNPGVKVPVVSLTEYEDYTAGEISNSFPVFDSYQIPQIERWVNGDRQYHIMSFLGDGWGIGNPRFPDEFVVGFTKYMNQRMGVMTWDVPTDENGLIQPPFFKQLMLINEKK